MKIIKKFIILSIFPLLSTTKNDYALRAVLADSAVEDCHPIVRPHLRTKITRNTLEGIKNPNRTALHYSDLGFIKSRLKLALNSVFQENIHNNYRCIRDFRYLPSDLKKAITANNKQYHLDKICLDEISKISNTLAASALLEAAYNK